MHVKRMVREKRGNDTHTHTQTHTHTHTHTDRERDRERERWIAIERGGDINIYIESERREI